ncbi:transposable element Tcb2 transposase [Trichonephila clavipes]|nr:transposable element Tcb2 transposase [Trichonephila clavipes]
MHILLTAINDAKCRPPSMVDLTLGLKNHWIAGILTITNRSVPNSECGPVCDLKTGRGFKEREMLPANQYQVDQESQPLAKTDIWRLNHDGLYARRPAFCIPLTSEHKRAHLNWILNHQHWSVGEWTNVMFSDESRFSLSSDSRRVMIWRERGTRLEPRNITERHHFPSRGVMVWAGIMMDSRTDLHFFDTGSVTAQRYRDEVLEPYVHLFRGAVGPDFIFMGDNAPCHRAGLIDDFLETENIQRISWPANSPDLIPIEHVWDMLGRQIAALSHPPSSVTELKRALQESWNRLNPQLIYHLIASMVNRCAACLAVRGDHTPY